MKSEFQAAINQVANDRNLPREVIIDAIRSALVKAYKRDYGEKQNIVATLDPTIGTARIFAEKQVVELIEDADLQVGTVEAQAIDPEAMLGSIVRVDVTPKNFGRIAAQTAKQVILQRIREAKRDHLFSNYSEREGELIVGTVQFIGPTGVTLALGDEAEATLLKDEQIPGEHYRREQRLRVFIYKVEKTSRGPQILVSRTHKKMLLRLMEIEVPEIANGVVEVRAIAREPGQRSKVAVSARQPGIDPVGSCVGLRGGRIQHIVEELSGEKIDIVPWNPDLATFIANAMSPAKVVSVTLTEGKTANVIVPDRLLSLAIGKEGQNARLAAKLTGWRIDIVNQTDAAGRALRVMEEAAARAEEERARRALEDQQRAEATALLAQAEATLTTEERPQVAADIATPEDQPWVEAALIPGEPAVVEEPMPQAFTDIKLDPLAVKVVDDAEEDETSSAAMKGKKKAKKGKREIAIEQRQLAAKKKKAPVRKTAVGGLEEDLDWQTLRNVKTDEILAEDEIAPVESPGNGLEEESELEN
ncbi:MAG: transcription termination/antitermination protein NusA [Chloroflexi bacterium]|nr:transcription termination/antitermination protein NusA [Chloroflexota bacterium]